MSYHKVKPSTDLKDGLLPIAEEKDDRHANGILHTGPSPSQGQPYSLRRFLRALKPSFFNSRASHSDGSGPAQHSSTLYLDGLRGYGSICVLNSHVITAFTNAPQNDWGWDDGMYLTPTSLPIIRLLFSGPGMVTLFFLISGFSCSLKPLEAMQNNHSPDHQARAMRSLSSSLLRRWFRLYLPVLACTLLVNLFVYLGAFELMPSYITSQLLLHPPQRFVAPKASLLKQLRFWYEDMYELLNLWHIWPNGTDAGYYAPFSNPHMWFITVEFKASLILYCTLMALAITRPGARFAVLLAAAGYMFLSAKDEILPYFFGACLACTKLALDAAQSAEKPLPGEGVFPWTSFSSSAFLARLSSFTELDRAPSRVTRGAWQAATVLSLWLLSTPAWQFHGPSYYVFTLIMPSAFVRQQTFLQLLGISGLLLCLMASSPHSLIRRILTHKVALYLGRISFAIYIVHGPVLLSVGYAVPIFFWQSVGDGLGLWLLGLVMSEAVTIGLSVWIADVFQREVEGRCVKLTRWIEGVMCGR